jgi:MYXO-CTERM domain-containing protein
MYEYSGAIDQTNGPATVSYIQTASGAPDQSGDFSTTPFSGSFTVPASNHIDLTTRINLNDLGGSAAIDKIEFNLATVPEPSSLPSVIMLTAGLGLAWRIRRRKQ